MLSTEGVNNSWVVQTYTYKWRMWKMHREQHRNKLSSVRGSRVFFSPFVWESTVGEQRRWAPYLLCSLSAARPTEVVGGGQVGRGAEALKDAELRGALIRRISKSDLSLSPPSSYSSSNTSHDQLSHLAGCRPLFVLHLLSSDSGVSQSEAGFIPSISSRFLPSQWFGRHWRPDECPSHSWVAPAAAVTFC